MSASSTDYYTKVGQPGNATVLAAPGHLIGGNSINVDSTSLWPTDTGVIFAIDTTTLVGGVETRNAGSYTVWEGVVTSATSIGSMVLLSGTDQNYSAGSTTRVYILPTSARENRLVDGLLLEHDQDGTHKNITTDTVTTTGNADLKTVITDTISEKTAGAGVTIDGLNIKDSKIGIAGLNNPYNFRVTRTSNQTGIPDSSYVQVQFNSKTFDTNNNFNTGTYKYTVPVTGYYYISTLCKATGSGIISLGLQILKNSGTQLTKSIGDFPSRSDASVSINDLIYLTATDTIYVEVFVNVSSGTGTLIGSEAELYLSGHLLSI